jgi:hypothetical protein
MDFDFFHSSGEAKRWAALQLLERAGEISELRRQVDVPLVTVDQFGNVRQWATFVADFSYLADGVRVIEDFKPLGAMTPDAALKIRCAEAMGHRVRVTNSKGEV